MMGKRKDSCSLFKESIDPRFSGIFNLTGNNSAYKISSDSKSQLHKNVGTQYNYSKSNENFGFQNFIGTKLAEYLDRHTKEVDRPVLGNDFFANKIEGICLFSDSDVITEEESVESVHSKPVKKKRKKERSNGSFKEVAVDYDWIQRQAQMLKS